nr:hypothetical protein [Actinophytocola sp.]
MSASRSVVACPVASELPAVHAAVPSRRLPTSVRIAVSASVPLCSIFSSAGTATPGFVPATSNAACAWTTMPVTWCATTSCSSLASAIRSPCCAEVTAAFTVWLRSRSRARKYQPVATETTSSRPSSSMMSASAM